MQAYTPQTILITGATGDFGRAFANRFALVGAKLILHGRNVEKLEKLQSELQAAHSDIETCICQFDITDIDATLKALDAISEDFAEIDLLINNAGGALGQAGAVESDLADWLAMIDMNNKSLVAVTHHVLQGMAARKRGHIINIGSTAGNYPYPGGHVYCAAKAFVKQFSLSLRSDTLDKNVRVTNIEPAMVETQFSKVRFKGDEEKANAVYAGTQALQAEDIAESAYWAATLPEHVNINRLEIMPTRQAPGPLMVDRD